MFLFSENLFGFLLLYCFVLNPLICCFGHYGVTIQSTVLKFRLIEDKCKFSDVGGGCCDYGRGIIRRG